jgi:hypothetical protein
MPTIVTLGYGYDKPTIIVQEVGDYIYAKVTIEGRITGSVLLLGQRVIGVVKEEGKLMSVEGNKITMYLRDDRTLLVEVNYENGDPVDLTDAKLWFTVKQKATDPDENAVVYKRNIAAGGSDTQFKVVNPPTSGQAQVYLVPGDTDLVNPGVYSYDIQVILANGKTYTVTRDQIIFKEDVTKARS